MIKLYNGIKFKKITMINTRDFCSDDIMYYTYYIQYRQCIKSNNRYDIVQQFCENRRLETFMSGIIQRVIYFNMSFMTKWPYSKNIYTYA